MRELIEQLDLEQVVVRACRTTRCDEATARDALLDVLSAMWAKQDQYKDTFRTSYGFQQYLQVSTVRHIVRLHGKASHLESLEEETLHHQEQTPEEQLLALLAQRDVAQVLDVACQAIAPQEARGIKKMLRLILKAPESYIRTRKTGKDTGHYAFVYSQLARDLRWPRRQVYQRLDMLRQALQSQGRRPHGEGT